VDTSQSQWYRNGYLNDGTGSDIDVTNPQYIRIPATGNCGVSSTIQSQTLTSNAWLGKGLVTVKYLGMSKVVSLTNAACFIAHPLTCVMYDVVNTNRYSV
jgi:hypothetical protein